MPRRMGRPGLVGTMARTAVITKTATTVAGNSAAKQAANAPAAPVEDDVATQITKLGELKAAGLIDDAEFAASKAKILGI